MDVNYNKNPWGLSKMTIFDMVIYNSGNYNQFPVYEKAILSDRLYKHSTDQFDVIISSMLSYFNQQHISGPNYKKDRRKMSPETLLTVYIFDFSVLHIIIIDDVTRMMIEKIYHIVRIIHTFNLVFFLSANVTM